jgi:hypothetical protein
MQEREPAMIALKPSRRRRPSRNFCWCSAMIALGVLNANGQDVDPLQQQLQELKK